MNLYHIKLTNNQKSALEHLFSLDIEWNKTELAGSSMDRLEARPEMANSSFSQRKRVDSMPFQYKSAHPRFGDSGSVGETRHPWKTEPAVGRVADGVAHRVDRLKAIGNGQVPLVAATAFSTLYKILNRNEQK